MAADHLERLAECALGCAPTLRPFVRPLFAPPAKAPAESELEEQEYTRSTEIAPASRERRPVVERAMGPEVRFAKEPLPPPSRESEGAIRRDGVRPPTARPATPPRRAHGVEVERAHLHVRADPTVSATHVLRPLTIEAPDEGRRPPAVPPMPGPLVVRRAGPESAHEATARTGQERAAEPTIRVTIGRVEVRAVMGQSPPPRAARSRPQPEQTLKEYLSGKRGSVR
jgi:hypothetical protein